MTAKLRIVVVLLCAFGVTIASAQVRTEFDGGQRIVGDVWKPEPTNSFYAPAGIPSANQAEYLLYIQGDENRYDGTSSVDKLILYTAPYTWAGLTNHFNYDRTLLPDVSQGFAASWYYGEPSAFSANGKYYLTSLYSRSDHDFDEILWGNSSDGRTFNWSRLLKYVGHDDDQYETPNGDPWSWGWIFRISGVTLRGPITINGTQYYWGFTNLKIRPPIDVCTGTDCSNNDNGDGFPDDPYWNDHTKPVGADGLGAILVQADGSPRGFSNVYLWHAGAWQQVQPDGTFAFIPDVVWQGYDKAKLQWLNSRWEIGVNIGSPSPQCPPNDPCRAVYNPAGGNQIFYIPVAAPVMWNQLPMLDFSTAYDLASLIRCMPGTYPNSRSYPFRVENTDLLYSSSNDQYCPANGDFWGMQIVVTRLQ